MWLGGYAQDDGGEHDGGRGPDGLDAPPYALADELHDDEPDEVDDWGEHDWAGDEYDVYDVYDEEGEEGEAPSRRVLVPAFALGAVVGMLLLGLVWGATAVFGGSDSPADKAPTGGANPQQAAESSPAAPSRPPPLERCRRADADLAAPLQAANAAMDQWEVHIGAMNKLVVGAISLQQANAFWNQTRVGAHRHLDRFHAADRAVPAVSCPAPDRVRPHASPALRSCVRRVAADQRALAAARTTLATWGMHVKDMDMLRMGHMTPAQATQMWLASWHSGTRQLHAYRDAEAALDGSGRC